MTVIPNETVPYQPWKPVGGEGASTHAPSAGVHESDSAAYLLKDMVGSLYPSSGTGPLVLMVDDKASGEPVPFKPAQPPILDSPMVPLTQENIGSVRQAMLGPLSVAEAAQPFSEQELELIPEGKLLVKKLMAVSDESMSAAGLSELDQKAFKWSRDQLQRVANEGFGPALGLDETGFSQGYSSTAGMENIGIILLALQNILKLKKELTMSEMQTALTMVSEQAELIIEKAKTQAKASLLQVATIVASVAGIGAGSGKLDLLRKGFDKGTGRFFSKAFPSKEGSSRLVLDETGKNYLNPQKNFEVSGKIEGKKNFLVGFRDKNFQQAAGLKRTDFNRKPNLEEAPPPVKSGAAEAGAKAENSVERRLWELKSNYAAGRDQGVRGRSDLNILGWNKGRTNKPETFDLKKPNRDDFSSTQEYSNAKVEFEAQKRFHAFRRKEYNVQSEAFSNHQAGLRNYVTSGSLEAKARKGPLYPSAVGGFVTMAEKGVFDMEVAQLEAQSQKARSYADIYTQLSNHYGQDKDSVINTMKEIVILMAQSSQGRAHNL